MFARDKGTFTRDEGTFMRDEGDIRENATSRATVWFS